MEFITRVQTLPGVYMDARVVETGLSYMYYTHIVHIVKVDGQLPL